MDYFDFFSGCGGTSEGMKQAGMAVRLGIDWDADAKSTYKVNFAKAKFISKDIRHIRVSDLAPFIPRNRRRPIVFGACAPCQPFSRQNLRRKGDDGRRTLLREFHRFVRAYKPEYLFVENVPELHAEDNLKGPFAEFLELLDSLKYSYAYKIVMAYHYGVPQSRRRLILIASRLGAIDFPSETHGPNAKNKKLPTVWESISKLPRLRAGEVHPEIPNHRAASLSELNLKRIAATPQGSGRAAWPKRLRLACHKDHLGHTDVYGRMDKHKPATALTTRCNSLSNGRFGHPTQNRAISLREAACLQTFPMTFEFQGSLASVARQIGNAVPVELAHVFGKAIIRHYKLSRKKAK
jgi:DNA (cytosine-5)-methyltransferase 1